MAVPTSPKLLKITVVAALTLVFAGVASAQLVNDFEDGTEGWSSPNEDWAGNSDSSITVEQYCNNLAIDNCALRLTAGEAQGSEGGSGGKSYSLRTFTGVKPTKMSFYLGAEGLGSYDERAFRLGSDLGRQDTDTAILDARLNGDSRGRDVQFNGNSLFPSTTDGMYKYNITGIDWENKKFGTVKVSEVGGSNSATLNNVPFQDTSVSQIDSAVILNIYYRDPSGANLLLDDVSIKPSGSVVSSASVTPQEPQLGAEIDIEASVSQTDNLDNVTADIYRDGSLLKEVTLQGSDGNYIASNVFEAKKGSYEIDVTSADTDGKTNTVTVSKTLDYPEGVYYFNSLNGDLIERSGEGVDGTPNSFDGDERGYPGYKGKQYGNWGDRFEPRAWNLDGENDYIEFGNPGVWSASNLGDTASSSIWVNFNKTDNRQRIFGHGSSPFPDRWGVSIRDLDSDSEYEWTGYVNTENGDGYFSDEDSTIPVEPGKWYNVMMVYDGSEAGLYINNTRVASKQISGTLAGSSSSVWTVGSRGANEYFLNASVDQLIMSQESWNATERGYVYDYNCPSGGCRFAGNPTVDLQNPSDDAEERNPVSFEFIPEFFSNSADAELWFEANDTREETVEQSTQLDFDGSKTDLLYNNSGLVPETAQASNFETLEYSWYEHGRTSNHPGTQSAFDEYFGGNIGNFQSSGEHTGESGNMINWHDGTSLPNSKPGYLPPDSYAWKAEGYFYAPTTGDYTFGVDSDDASDVFLKGNRVAYWYDGHGTQGDTSADYSGHTGTVNLEKGWHSFKARMEEGGGGDGISVGVQKPGDSSLSPAPITDFAKNFDDNSGGTGFYESQVFDEGEGGKADLQGYTISGENKTQIEVDFAENSTGEWKYYDTASNVPESRYWKYNASITNARLESVNINYDLKTNRFTGRKTLENIQNGQLQSIDFNFDRERLPRFHGTVFDTATDWSFGQTTGLEAADSLRTKASKFASIYSDNFGQDAENGITIPLGTSREVQEPYTKSGDTIEFKEDGKYVISYSSSYESSAPSRLIMRNYIEKNGNLITPSETRCYIRNDQTGDSCQNAATFIIQANAGDTISMRGTKDHGDCCTIYTRQDQYLNARKLELPAAQVYDSSGTDNYDQGTKTISMDTETFVDSELFSFNSNQNGIKVSEDGWYKVYYTANFHSIYQGDRQAPLTYIRVNGQTVPANELRSTTYIRNDGDGDENHNTASGLVQLEAGDTVQVRVEQEYTQSGDDSDVINDEAWMTMHPANSQALQVERRGSEQRINDNTWTDVNFDTINKDSDRFDYSSGSSGITIQDSGYYTIDYTFGWDDDAVNGRHRVYSRLTKNGNEIDATRSRDYTRGCCTAGRTNSMSHTTRMYLQQGDTIRLQGYSTPNYIDVDEGDTYLTISPGIQKNKGTYTSEVISSDEEGSWDIKEKTVSGNPEIDFATNTTGQFVWYDDISQVPETRYLKYNATLDSDDSIDSVNIGSIYDEIFDFTVPQQIDWNIQIQQDDGQTAFAPTNYNLTVQGVDKPEINSITTTPSEGSIGYNDVVDIQADVTESTKQNEDVDEVWADVYEDGEIIAQDVDLTDSNGDNIYEAEGVYQQDRGNITYRIEVFANNTLQGLRFDSTSRRFNDAQPPSVDFLENDGTPSGEINEDYIFYTMQATDNNAVDSVNLNYDGSDLDMTSEGSDIYSYNLTGLSEGTYSLFGEATDIAGNKDDTKTLGVPFASSEWNERKKIQIEEKSSQSLSDYSVKHIVQKESGMNNDYSDLRFYYYDGNTQQEIDYYIEDYNSNQAEVWFEVPSLPADGKATVYMYYDNGDASSQSNGAETFRFYDGFEGGDLTKWTGDTGGFSVDTSDSFSGSQALSIDTDESFIHPSSADTIPSGETIELISYTKDTNSGTNNHAGWYIGSDHTSRFPIEYQTDPENEHKIYDDTAETTPLGTTSDPGGSTGNWYRLRLRYDPDTGDATIEMEDPSDGSIVHSDSGSIATGHDKLGLFGWTSGWYYDNIIVKQAVSTEPSTQVVSKSSETGQTFTVDLTSPNIKSVSITEGDRNGQLEDGEQVDITAKIVEKNTIESVTADTAFAGAGQTTLQQQSKNSDTYTFTGSFQVDQSQAADSGEYTIDLTAKDKAGNTGTGSSGQILLISDPSPENTANTPADNVTKANPVNFKYTPSCYGSNCEASYLKDEKQSGTITADTTEELNQNSMVDGVAVGSDQVFTADGDDLTFTTCGSTGESGASQSQCDSAYSGTPLEGEVTVVGSGMQEWTTDYPGSYRMKLYGAEGGRGCDIGSPCSDDTGEGSGAIIAGDVSLDSGQTLRILVGQKGLDANNGDGGGGGGGASLVAPASDLQSPYLIAGGGGGGAEESGGEDANTGTTGVGATGSGGTDGDGGSGGNGGAGLLTDGDGGGQALIDGGLGGGSLAGFGGGSYSGGNDGAGGGGYSGGGAGTGISAQGGGGGSFIHESVENAATSDGSFSTTGSEPQATYSGTVEDLNNWNGDVGKVEIQEPSITEGSYTKVFDGGNNKTRWTDVNVESSGEIELSYGTNKTGTVQYYRSIASVPSHRYLFVKAELQNQNTQITSISADYFKYYKKDNNPVNGTENQIQFDFRNLDGGMPEALNWTVKVEDEVGQFGTTTPRLLKGIQPEVNLIRPLTQATAPVDFDFSGICDNPNGCEKAEVWYNSTETLSENITVDNSTEWSEGTFTNTESDGTNLVLKPAGYPANKQGGQLEYRFESGSGSTAVDTFNNFDGSFNGGVNFAPSKGDKATGDYAASFDNGGDLIDTNYYASDFNIEGGKPKTITAWAYTENFNGGGIWQLGSTGTSGYDFSLRTLGTQDEWRWQSWGGTYDQDFFFDSHNKWVHFAGVYDGSTLYVYANGQQVASQTADYNTVDGNGFQVGTWEGTEFRGDIDEVRIYDQALTQSEIQDIYNAATYEEGSYESKVYSAEKKAEWVNVQTNTTGTATFDYAENTTGSWKWYDTLEDVPETKHLKFNTTLQDGATIDSVVFDYEYQKTLWNPKHTIEPFNNDTEYTVTDEFLQEDTPFTLNWNVKVYQENGIDKFYKQNQTIEVIDSTVYQENVNEQLDGVADTDRDKSFFTQFTESMNLVENAKGIKTYIVPDFSAVVNITQGEVLADRRKRGAVTAIMNATDATERSFEGARVMDETVSGTFESAATAFFPRNTSSESLAITDNIQDTLNEVRLLQPENVDTDESADRQFEGNRLMQEISSFQSATAAGYTGTRSTSQSGNIQTDTIIQQYAQSHEGIIATSSATRGINQVRNLIVALGRVSIDTDRAEADLERNITTSPQGDTSVTRQIDTRGLVSEQITAASDVYRGFFRENIRETATADTSIVDILTEVRFINPDRASVNSSATRQADITQEVSDIPTLNSAVTRAFTGDRNVSQSGEIDAEREGIGKFFYVNDSLESEAITGEAYVGFLRQNVATVATTDTVERPFIDITIPIIQETGANTSATRTQDVTELIGADSVGFSSEIIRAFPRSVSQQTSVNATGEFINLQRIRQITEVITGSSNVTRQADISQTVTQRASVFGDTALGYFRQTEPDNIATNSSVQDILTQVQFVSEEGFLNSTVDRQAEVTQEVSDIPTVSSLVDRAFTGSRNVSDNSTTDARLSFIEEVFVSEQVGMSALSEYTKIYTGYVSDDSAADTNLIRSFESTRALEAVNKFTDSVSRDFTGSRSVIQAIYGEADSYKQQYRQLDDRVEAVSSVQDTLTQVEFITESGQTGDSIERSYVGERFVDSIPTLGDAVTRNIEANRSAQDNPEATADSIIQQYRDSVAQSNLDDSAIRRMENVRNDVVGEATLTESVGRAFTGKRTTVEYTTLTDVMTRTTDFVRDEQEQVETEEDFIVTYGFLVEDTVQTATTISDLLNQFRFSAEQTDTVADSDRNISSDRDFQEGVDTVDEQDRTLVDERRIQEPLMADTSIDATVKNFRNLIAPVEGTTQVSDILNQVRNDNTLRTNLTAESNRSILVDRLMDAEPLTVTENMERSIDFRRTEGEAIDTTEDIYKIEYQQLQEQLDVNESAERRVRFIQDLEPSQLEIVERQERSYKGLREPVLNSESVATLERSFVEVRKLSEVVESNTEIYRGLFRDIQAQLIDVIAKEERVLENIRVVQDNATGQEEVVRNVSWEREAQVIPVLTDLTTRSGEFSNEVSDTANIDSSVAVGRFFYIEDQQLVVNSDVSRTYFRVKEISDAINATTGDIVFEYFPERKGQAVFSVNASTDRGFIGERTVEEIAESEDAEPLLAFASDVYTSPTMQSTLNTSTLVQDRLNTAVDTVTSTDNLLFMEGNRLFTTIAFDSNTSEQTTVPETLQTDFAYNETVYIAYEAGQNIITGSFVEDTSSLITIRNGQVIYEPLFTEQSLPEFLQDTYVARTTQIHLFGLIALAIVLYLGKTWRDRNREIKEYKADRTGEGSG